MDIGIRGEMERLATIFMFASICAVAPSCADESDRLASEATALFQVIIAAEAPPHRCQFSTKWESAPVPEYVAQKFLGLTVHADLAPPFQITSFEDVLDPEKKSTSAFCDQPVYAAFEKAQFDAFEKDKSARKVRIERTWFAFPIFDAAYQRAIVITSRSGIERDRLDIALGRMKPGEIMRHPGFNADFANVYSKSSGGWKLTASEMIEQS